MGAKGLVYVKYNEAGTFKSSVDKFYSPDDLQQWADAMGAVPGDLMLILAGETSSTRKALSELRLEMGRRLELMDPNVFKPLWVVDFPLLEWDEETERSMPCTIRLPVRIKRIWSCSKAIRGWCGPSHTTW